MQKNNKKIKVKFDIPLDYIAGYLRYGHREGILELTEEEFNKLKENPADFLCEEDLICDLDIVIDDYRIEDCGPITEVNYKVVSNEE